MIKFTGLEEALFELQKIGLELNELKQSGCEEVPISNFEQLLDWTIESITTVKDATGS